MPCSAVSYSPTNCTYKAREREGGIYLTLGAKRVTMQPGVATIDFDLTAVYFGT